MNPNNSSVNKSLSLGAQIVVYILGIIEILLLFRFVLKLFGANLGADFTNFIYDITYVFLTPFIDVFRITIVEGSVFDWTTLLAMIVYWVIALAIVKIFVMGKPDPVPDVVIKVDSKTQ
jgi:hypothetical protein